MCVLVVEGSIDLKQFWPEGDSDADTVHVLVDPAKSFRIEGTRLTGAAELLTDRRVAFRYITVLL